MPVYLSPGVYVLEVPSAQQPIAAVGTNTVGFIGVVPDEIIYPVANDDYDPQAALTALGGPETNKQETDLIEKEIRSFESRLGEAQKAVDGLNARVAGVNKEDPNLTQAQRKDFRDLEKRTKEVEQLKSELDSRRKKLDELKQPPRVDEKSLKPYRLAGRDAVDATGKPIPAFDVKSKAASGDAKLCTNFTEFTDRFGPFSADDPTKDPGEALHPGHRALAHGVYGFFANGGTRCFVARVSSDNAAEIDKALTGFESIDEIAIVATPGLEGGAIWNLLVAHCNKMEDRFAILDSQADVETNGELDVTLLNYTNLNNVLPQTSKNAAFYFPHIEVIDPAKQLQDQDPARGIPTKHRGKVYVPPSGHVAGIYARVDEQRGVHKAPGNEAVIGALDVKYYIGKRKQDLLNPQGVNCIRNLNGNIRVYGARTIGGDKNTEWKYVNVRRVFLFLRESIDEGTQWVVFEPNDRSLWGKINRNVTAFLTIVWRDGALFGSTPQEAFYVKCDEETNPPEVRDLGQVVTEIGVAIVRPAEFVIFKVAQWAGPRGTTA